MPLLNQREAQGVKYAIARYKQRVGPYPERDDDLIVFLGDTPANRLCWTATSRRIPTYRRNGGKMWHVRSKSWMSSRDKLASLGFPVTESMATSMGVPAIPIQDQLRASSVAGNSFHFATAACVQLIALCCFKVQASD